MNPKGGCEGIQGVREVSERQGSNDVTEESGHPGRREWKGLLSLGDQCWLLLLQA
jgi:hypothetical protein